MFEKLSASQRKMLNWLGFIVVVGVGFMLVQPPKNNSSEISRTKQISTPYIEEETTHSNQNQYTSNVEQRLQQILSQVEGAGAVEVFITLDRSSKIIVAESITEDIKSDQQRTVKSPITLRVEGGSKEVPLVLAEYEPELRGVLIVAPGATNPDIRYQILRATQTVLQIPMYKIEVLAKEI